MARAAILAIVISLTASLSIKGNSDMERYKVGITNDSRFTDIRHLDKTYSFTAPKTKKEWRERANYLREHILVSTGLSPMPKKKSLNAVIFDRLEYDNYTVEKVYFESHPGFYVAGNLFRPKGKKGPFPAVLNPHGHARLGRLEDTERSSTSARCINLAKQGYVAFSYDKIGYNDSKQVQHRAGELDGEREYLWGISIGGMQLWNSIRAGDFLQSLPDVDSKRISCTGGSGGGTQTFMLKAVDDRIVCSSPVNMVSSTMQGGCQCENPPLLRIETNNMEISALAAPRPLFLVSATGDWTKLTPEVEYPSIKSVYSLLGVEERVGHILIDAGHNYNKDSREAVYEWFGLWILGIDYKESLKEQSYKHEKDEDLLSFHDRPLPENALDVESFIESRIQAARQQLEDLRPIDAQSRDHLCAIFSPALRHSLALETPANVTSKILGEQSFDHYSLTKMAIKWEEKGHEIPALLFSPQGHTNKAALVVHGEGKFALIEDGKPGNLVKGLIERGYKVFAIDCFNVGEHKGPPESEDRMTRYRYFTTYNKMDTAERVQDIITALTYLKGDEIDLIGIGHGGLWSMLARAFSSDVLNAVVDTAGFDNTSDQAFIDELFTPSLRRAGDFRTAGSMIAPGRMMIHNTRGNFKTDWIEEAYNAVGEPMKLQIRGTRASDEAILEWLGV